MKRVLSGTLIAIACLILFSCHKHDTSPTTAMGAPPFDGLYVLTFEHQDTSSLSLYNLNTRQSTPYKFSDVNKQVLGNGATDLEIYGTKMYIALSNSCLIAILDAQTGKLIKKYSLGTPTLPKRPQKLTFYKNNVYITCNEGTIDIMDTLSLTVNSTIPIPGHGYEIGVAVANNKLYVANSGGNRDTTVSVIDLATNQVIKTIDVLPSPNLVTADSYGNVYVLSYFTDDYMEYFIRLGGMSIIDSRTDEVKNDFPSNGGVGGPITSNGELVYYANEPKKISVYNARTQSIVTDNFVTDGTDIQNLADICVNPDTGEVYIADVRGYTSNGVVDVFDKTGKLEYSIATGAPPIKLKFFKHRS